MIQEIVLDKLPPSTNHTHGRNKWGGMYMKKAGVEFMTYVALTCKKNNIKLHEGFVEVDIIGSAGRYKTTGEPKRMDMQNVEKILFDSLQGHAYKDDVVVWKHSTTRVDDVETYTKIIIKDYEPARQLH